MATSHDRLHTPARPSRVDAAKAFAFASCLVAAFAGSAGAQSVKTINFDRDWVGNSIAPGSTLNNQYMGWGVSITPSALSGPSGISAETDWATNTDMHIGVSAGAGLRAGGGNHLHQYNGWLNEDGDPVFRIEFMTPIDELSIVFTGINPGTSSAGFRIFDRTLNAFTRSVYVQDPALASGLTTQTLSLTGLSGATDVYVMPGTYNDWVGIDDITFRQQTLPAPGSAALLAASCAFGLRRSRRRI